MPVLSVIASCVY